MTSLETLHDAVATPTIIVRQGEGKIAVSGCIYRKDGSKCSLSERASGFKGDVVKNDNSDSITIPKRLKYVPGRSVYLHHWMGNHYGHFLTETVSNLLMLVRESPSSFDHFVFHSFIFGGDMSSYSKDALRALGVELDKIIIVESQALKFETLVVPERLWALNSHADPNTREVYQAISTFFERNDPTPKRIYFSRRKVSRRTFRRVIVNESTVEDVFTRFGFAIVYPELETFERQVQLCSQAEMIAGFSGSALHNSVFMQRSATLIEIGHPRYGGPPSPNQPVCNSISGVNSVYVPFSGRVIGSRETVIFRSKTVDRSLQLLFSPSVTSSSYHLLSIQFWRDRFEMGILLLRPLLGESLRQTIDWFLRRP